MRFTMFGLPIVNLMKGTIMLSVVTAGVLLLGISTTYAQNLGTVTSLPGIDTGRITKDTGG